jgi:hypothetical protein
VGWYEKYGPEGLVVIGVHSPEFPWERPMEKVKKACGDLGITYPVALDNDFAIWNHYRTRYWPTLHLIDKNGIVRYTRYGEGGYEQTESMIEQLLREQR